MGQYFLLMNFDKKEVVNPWDLGGGAKLWEWCASKTAGVIPYLLRRSTGDGGGDVGTALYYWSDKSRREEVNALPSGKQSRAFKEEFNRLKSTLQYAGRWADDRIALVGDYDVSGDYSRADFTDITEGLIEEYNEFIYLDDKKVGR